MPHASRRTFHLHSPTLPDPAEKLWTTSWKFCAIARDKIPRETGPDAAELRGDINISLRRVRKNAHASLLDCCPGSDHIVPLCVFASRKIHCRCRHPKISQSLNFKRGQHKAAGVISTFNSQNLVADLQPPPAQRQHLRLRPLTIPAIDRPPTALYPRRPVHD